jgi:hypothetical protein
MVAASIRYIRYFLLILVIFVLGFGSALFVLVHKPGTIGTTAAGSSISISAAASAALGSLERVGLLLLGSETLSKDDFAHLPHSSVMYTCASVVVITYWVTVIATLATMVLALVSKSCDARCVRQ